MKKTELLKMRIEEGCIYLGRKGKKVYVWTEAGEEVNISALPVFNRKFIKTKIEQIPEIKGEVNAEGVFDEAKTPSTENTGEKTPTTQTTTTVDDDKGTQGEGEGDTDSDADTHTDTDSQTEDQTETDSTKDSDDDKDKEPETDEDSDKKEEEVTVESLKDKHTLKELKAMAQESAKKVEEKTGRKVELTLSSKDKAVIAEKVLNLEKFLKD